MKTNKEAFYIYQEIIKKQGAFSIWMNDEFWIRWFNLDLMEKGKIFEESQKEEIYFMIILEISAIMNNLNIDIKTIVYCLIEKIALKFIVNDKTLLKEIETTILKQHQNKIKVSEKFTI